MEQKSVSGNGCVSTQEEIRPLPSQGIPYCSSGCPQWEGVGRCKLTDQAVWLSSLCLSAIRRAFSENDELRKAEVSRKEENACPACRRIIGGDGVPLTEEESPKEAPPLGRGAKVPGVAEDPMPGQSRFPDFAGVRWHIPVIVEDPQDS